MSKPYYYYVGADGKLYKIFSENVEVIDVEPTSLPTTSVAEGPIPTSVASIRPITPTLVDESISLRNTVKSTAALNVLAKPTTSAKKSSQLTTKEQPALISRKPASSRPAGATQKSARIITKDQSNGSTTATKVFDKSKNSLNAAVTQKPGRVTVTDQSKNQKKNKNKKPRIQDIFDDKSFIHSIEHRLLEEIFDRPPLFDSSLSIQQRSSDVRIKLYEEIATMMNDEFETFRITWQIVSNTWNQYRTLYVRYTNALKLTRDGSVSTRLPGPPMHLSILTRYDPIIEKRNQVSSLSKVGLSMFPPCKRKTKAEAVGKYLQTATDFLEKVKPGQATSNIFTPESNSALAFFYSLMPYIEKMNSKDELCFRKTVFDILYDKMADYEEETGNRGQSEQNEEYNMEYDNEDEGEHDGNDQETEGVQEERVTYDAYYGLDVYSDDE